MVLCPPHVICIHKTQGGDMNNTVVNAHRHAISLSISHKPRVEGRIGIIFHSVQNEKKKKLDLYRSTDNPYHLKDCLGTTCYIVGRTREIHMSSHLYMKLVFQARSKLIVSICSQRCVLLGEPISC